MSKSLSRDYREINRKFVTAAVLTMLFYGGILAFCRFVLNFDPTKLVATGTIIFQFGVVGWGLGFIGAYFVRMEKKTDLSLKLGNKTVDTLDEVQQEMKPLIADVKSAMGDVKDIVRQFKKRNFEGVQRSLEELTKDGTLKRAAESVEHFPAKIDELIREVRAARSEKDGL